MVLKACIKKEYLEELRTKRFYAFLGAAIGMALFALFINVVMQIVAKALPADVGEGNELIGEIKELFQLNYQTMFTFFATFMIAYFSFIIIFFQMRNISKEIKDKKWITPITSGIDPTQMIGAKLVVKNLSVVIACVAGCLLHLILTVSIASPAVVNGITIFGMGDLMLGYLCIILNALLFSNLTLCINAISKKTWPAVVFPIVVLILISSILEEIKISGQALINYTPLVFYEKIMAGGVINTTQWIIGSITFVAFIAGMIVWALFANKIKVQRDVK